MKTTLATLASFQGYARKKNANSLMNLLFASVASAVMTFSHKVSRGKSLRKSLGNFSFYARNARKPQTES